MRYSSKQSLRGYSKATQGSITPTIAGYVVVSDPRLPHEMKEESNDSSDSRLIVTYNVEDASEPTQLYFYMVQEGAPFSIRGVDMFDKVEIDGTEVSITDLDTASGAYQLSVGEHTIAYTLKDPTFIGAEYDEETETPTKIGAMFMNCDAITSAQIPNSVTSICGDAFYNCTDLTSIEIPNGCTSIGESAFAVCESLTSIIIPNSVTIIGDNAFDACYNITNVTIGNGITGIGNGVFGGCGFTTIIIPNSVTSIGDSAFENCESLTSINIPNSVTSIGNTVFQNCGNLTSVTIGNGITSIGNTVFTNCSYLSSITCNSTTPPTLGFAALNGTNCPIYVPSESVESYKTAWGAYASRIQSIT